MELIPETSDLNRYLEATDLVNFDDASVRQLADRLTAGASDDTDKVKAVYEYIQKNIPHTFNTGRSEVSRKASDVIMYGHGVCYAKAMLAAAMLRYMGIPTGFCYQKFSSDDTPGPRFVLHCINAVYLNGGWFRIDVRNVVDGFDPAFKPGMDSGIIPSDAVLRETDYQTIYVKPNSLTVKVLKSSKDANALRERLPEGLYDP